MDHFASYEVPPLGPDSVAGAILHANRHDLVRALSRYSPTSIAEIGVAFGDFSKYMIDTLKPKSFDAYDMFLLHEVELIWGVPARDIFGPKTHFQFYSDVINLYNRTYSTALEVSIFEGDSSTLLAASEKLYDLIYIDGDHSYEDVKKDAEASIQRLAPSGTLVFNDYIMFDHIGKTPYGIVPVVNQLCKSGQWKVTDFAFQENMFCDIALRRT